MPTAAGGTPCTQGELGCHPGPGWGEPSLGDNKMPPPGLVLCGCEMANTLATLSGRRGEDRQHSDIGRHGAQQHGLFLSLVGRACEALEGVRDLAGPFVQEASAGRSPGDKNRRGLAFEVARAPSPQTRWCLPRLPALHGLEHSLPRVLEPSVIK